jgi:hypothetical protein
LEAVLNDEFDPIARDIYISDAEKNLYSMFIFRRSEDRPLMLPKIINKRGFSGSDGFDFIINIPAEKEGNLNEKRLKSIVNIYKLASKRYSINYI